jgi:hypothetical protein
MSDKAKVEMDRGFVGILLVERREGKVTFSPPHDSSLSLSHSSTLLDGWIELVLICGNCRRISPSGSMWMKKLSPLEAFLTINNQLGERG